MKKIIKKINMKFLKLFLSFAFLLLPLIVSEEAEKKVEESREEKKEKETEEKKEPEKTGNKTDDADEPEVTVEETNTTITQEEWEKLLGMPLIEPENLTTLEKDKYLACEELTNMLMKFDKEKINKELKQEGFLRQGIRAGLQIDMKMKCVEGINDTLTELIYKNLTRVVKLKSIDDSELNFFKVNYSEYGNLTVWDFNKERWQFTINWGKIRNEYNEIHNITEKNPFMENQEAQAKRLKEKLEKQLKEEIEKEKEEAEAEAAEAGKAPEEKKEGEKKEETKKEEDKETESLTEEEELKKYADEVKIFKNEDL